MCGIVGFIGASNGRKYLLEGLSNLEYRGYDSAGIGFLTDTNALHIIKSEGKLNALREKYMPQTENIYLHTGIGHTRWATHGTPSERNAHPIASYTGRFAIVHNGIVENYYDLHETLLKAGIPFHSETDTEVLINYIDYRLGKEKNLYHHLPALLKEDITGSFAVLIIDRENPDTLLCIRRKSPMCLGKNEADFYLASDPNAFSKNVVSYTLLPDCSCTRLIKKENSIAYECVDFLRAQSLSLTFENSPAQNTDTQKGAYEHYMIKEIREQSFVLKALYSANIHKGVLQLPLKKRTLEKFASIRSVCLIGCGTSYHASKFGEYVFESTGLQAFSESGGEFKYRETSIYSDTLYIFLSQSGETADIITTVEKVREMGGYTLGITNVMNSSLCFLVDDVIFMKAGPEISVASTKAFTAQLLCLLLLAQTIASAMGRSLAGDTTLNSQLESIDNFLEEEVFTQIPTIRKIAQEYIAPASITLFTGRNVNYPIAMEGALKLKEISYINCHGMPIGELKHGTIALIDEQSITLAVESRPEFYAKFISNVQEILARKGKVIVIKSNIMRSLEHKNLIEIHYPHQHNLINTLVNAVFLQLFSYYTALCFDVNIDRPRNLAKSVTVE